MYSYSLEKHELKFKVPAKTSRNVFTTRGIFLITLRNTQTGQEGIGEASPLSLLSVDDVPDYQVVLEKKLQKFCEVGSLDSLSLDSYPSIRFGIETALLNMSADNEGVIFNSDFTARKKSIPINGLVWMNDSAKMYDEAIQKIQAGFDVIKIKVGALDFDEECRLLESIRKQFSAFKITLRVDANGAFSPNDALEKLNELKRFDLHSIEQPIASGQWDWMQKICAESPIDIALDEELIGLNVHEEANKMIKYIHPKYLILKPNLIGGLSISDEWIKWAHKHNLGWWATSALESNVGLNAIAQWVSTYQNPLHQGLGTGSLFTNNFSSRLKIERGQMQYV
ncbi:MAG: o-succinylbenzoate synthase [Bacteroidia bacterium]|nr:o-succinylbenzoate synthase [Bacteroidia bacterium]|tara:strand:+ start:803 stop:1819 length:1017 start_codon:yes stop_codon:yes gene_type:complete